MTTEEIIADRKKEIAKLEALIDKKEVNYNLSMGKWESDHRNNKCFEYGKGDLLKRIKKASRKMECRQITQGRIYVLVLNTFGKAEESRIAAISDDYQRLADYYNSQLLSSENRFRDENGFLHSFCEGELFNLNPCGSIELNNLDWYGNGIHDEWIYLENWETLCQSYFVI